MHYHFISLASNCHFKPAHLFIPRMHDMTKLYLSISNGNNVICDICHFAKAIKVPYNFIFSHSKVNFELLHFNICGSTSTQYFHRYKYNLTTLDYFIIFKRIILSKYKDEISTHFQSFTQLIENQYNVVPKLWGLIMIPSFPYPYFTYLNELNIKYYVLKLHTKIIGWR